MAITIAEAPRDFSILHQKLMYTCTSGNVANTGFRFQFEVTVGGDTLTFLVPPNPNNKGMFDVREAIRGYFVPLLTPQDATNKSLHDLGRSDTVLHKYEDAATSTWIMKIDVVVKEGWIIAGVFTPTAVGQATDSFVCVSWKPDTLHGAFATYRQDYTGQGANLLTDMVPRTRKTKFENKYKYGLSDTDIFIPVRSHYTGIVSFLADNGTLLGGDTPAKVRGVIYESDGTSHTADYSITANGTGRLVHFGAYPKNLNETDYATFIKPSDYPGFRYYTLQVLNSANDALTALYVFYPESEYDSEVDCATNDYLVRVTWINSLGGWDYFDFTKQYVERYELNRKRTRRILGTYGSTAFDYTQYDRGLEEVDVQSELIIAASSDWLTAEEFDFLANMYRSKYVYMLAPNILTSEIVPVVIDQPNYDAQKTNFTQTKRLDVAFKVAVPLW